MTSKLELALEEW